MFYIYWACKGLKNLSDVCIAGDRVRNYQYNEKSKRPIYKPESEYELPKRDRLLFGPRPKLNLSLYSPCRSRCFCRLNLLVYCKSDFIGHDDVIKWKHFARYFVWRIHRKIPNKGQRRGALLFSLTIAWINGWVNNRGAGDLRRHRAHYDVIVMALGQSRGCPVPAKWPGNMYQINLCQTKSNHSKTPNVFIIFGFRYIMVHDG